MRRIGLALVLVALLSATPPASAWAYELSLPVDGDLSTRTSLLAAGAVNATVRAGLLGAIGVTHADFGPDLVVTYCPADSVGLGGCARGETTQEARLRVREGGFLLQPVAGQDSTLRAAAGVAALGGANLTSATGEPLGPGLFAGGDITLSAGGTTFLLRPLTNETSIVVRGANGSIDYNGSDYVLQLSNAQGARITATGGFLRLEAGTHVTVAPAPLDHAESALTTDRLHTLIRTIVPPERADRRADIIDAFGPFQIVPALLNGVVASANLTLPGRDAPQFVLLRTGATTIELTEDDAWRLSGDATSTVQGTRFAKDADAPPRTPLVIPILLALGAIAARLATPRETPNRKRRLTAHAIRMTLILLLTLLATYAMTSILGLNPLAHLAALNARSTVQLLLLALGMALTATLLVGLAASSLARSALAATGRPAPILTPPLIGAATSAILLLLHAPALASLVARLVRL